MFNKGNIGLERYASFCFVKEMSANYMENDSQHRKRTLGHYVSYEKLIVNRL